MVVEILSEKGKEFKHCSLSTRSICSLKPKMHLPLLVLNDSMSLCDIKVLLLLNNTTIEVFFFFFFFPNVNWAV
jgi:hypothetical protein